MEYSKGYHYNLLDTLGKTSSRTSKARLEFHPEYPLNTMSAYKYVNIYTNLLIYFHHQ